MRYLKDKKVVIMDLADLEHCGFSHDEFDFELRTRGIEDPEARWPVALIVNFGGGAVVTPRTSEKTVSRMKEMKKQFDNLLGKLF